MSVTFRVHGIGEEQGYELPCPFCKRSMRDVVASTEHVPCTECDGYGGPPELPQPQFELNVHQGNAGALLRLLQLDNAPAGSVDPVDLLVKLSLTPCPAAHERHFAQLAKIAKKARRYERSVVWD